MALNAQTVLRTMFLLRSLISDQVPRVSEIWQERKQAK